MNVELLLYILMLSCIVTMFCFVLASLARNKAREEIYKRKVIESKYNHCKTLFAAKEKALKYHLEAKEKEISSLSSKMKILEIQIDKSNRISNTEDINMKYLLEAKENKIEAQHAKITMLQADCNRLKRELKVSGNNNVKIVENSTNNKK